MKKEVITIRNNKRNVSFLAIVFGIVIFLLYLFVEKKYFEWFYCLLVFFAQFFGFYFLRKNFSSNFKGKSLIQIITAGIVFFIAIKLFMQLDYRQNDFLVFFQHFIYAFSMVLYGILILLWQER